MSLPNDFCTNDIYDSESFSDLFLQKGKIRILKSPLREWDS